MQFRVEGLGLRKRPQDVTDYNLLQLQRSHIGIIEI